MHTIDTSVVRLNESLSDLAVLHGKSVTLAALVAKDGGAVEGHVEGLGEFTGGVTKEADLVRHLATGLCYCYGERVDIRRSCRWGRGMFPKPWFYYGQ